MANPYGSTRTPVGNSKENVENRNEGRPRVTSDDYATMNIGDRLQEENPYIIDREAAEVPVSAATCCLDGSPKGFVTVKRFAPPKHGYMGEK